MIVLWILCNFVWFFCVIVENLNFLHKHMSCESKAFKCVKQDLFSLPAWAQHARDSAGSLTCSRKNQFHDIAFNPCLFLTCARNMLHGICIRNTSCSSNYCLAQNSDASDIESLITCSLRIPIFVSFAVQFLFIKLSSFGARSIAIIWNSISSVFLRNVIITTHVFIENWISTALLFIGRCYRIDWRLHCSDVFPFRTIFVGRRLLFFSSAWSRDAKCFFCLGL